MEWPEFVKDILSVGVRVRPSAVDGLHTLNAACQSRSPVETSDPSWRISGTGGTVGATVGIYLWGYLLHTVTGAKWVAQYPRGRT